MKKLRRSICIQAQVLAVLCIMTVVAPMPVHGQRSSKCGYIDRRGVVVIAPTFVYAGEFHGGMASVMGSEGRPQFPYPFSGSWGFVDRTGKAVIAPAADPGFPEFSEGLARAGGAFRDTHGKTVLEPTYTCMYGGKAYARRYVVGSFHDGLASAQKVFVFRYPGKDTSPHAGYIDHSGRIIIPLKYSDVRDFSEGMAAVEVGEKWGYVDAVGRLVIPAQYDAVGPFSEGWAFVQNGQTWGFIDHAGKMVLRPRAPISPLPALTVFREGLAAVISGGRYGFMDRSGRMVIEPKYANEGPFSEGLAPVQLPNRQWVYINLAGRIVFRPVWHNSPAQSADGFSEGLAAVSFDVADAK